MVWQTYGIRSDAFFALIWSISHYVNFLNMVNLQSTWHFHSCLLCTITRYECYKNVKSIFSCIELNEEFLEPYNWTKLNVDVINWDIKGAICWVMKVLQIFHLRSSISTVCLFAWKHPIVIKQQQYFCSPSSLQNFRSANGCYKYALDED